MSDKTELPAESASASRRESLKLFGRYAAAATPAMMILLGSQKEAEAGWKGKKKMWKKKHRGSKWY